MNTIFSEFFSFFNIILFWRTSSYFLPHNHFTETSFTRSWTTAAAVDWREHFQGSFLSPPHFHSSMKKLLLSLNFSIFFSLSLSITYTHTSFFFVFKSFTLSICYFFHLFSLSFSLFLFLSHPQVLFLDIFKVAFISALFKTILERHTHTFTKRTCARAHTHTHIHARTHAFFRIERLVFGHCSSANGFDVFEGHCFKKEREKAALQGRFSPLKRKWEICVSGHVCVCVSVSGRVCTCDKRREKSNLRNVPACTIRNFFFV